MLVMALSATPSSIPAKIRNSVAAKCQLKSNKAANPTTPMPPAVIAHARSLRAARRSLAETATLIPFQAKSDDGTLSSNAPGIKRRWRAGLTLACWLCKAINGMGSRHRERLTTMNLKWVGPVALLAALVIGDQIRIN